MNKDNILFRGFIILVCSVGVYLMILVMGREYTPVQKELTITEQNWKTSYRECTRNVQNKNARIKVLETLLQKAVETNQGKSIEEFNKSTGIIGR